MTPTTKAIAALTGIIAVFMAAIYIIMLYGQNKAMQKRIDDLQYQNKLLMSIDIKQDKAMCRCYNYPNHDSLTQVIIKRLTTRKKWH